MTIAQLRQRSTYWQERLNIKEWKIAVRWGTRTEMGSCELAPAGASGACSWVTEYLTAEIWIDRKTPDPEFILIHELLHVVIDGHAEYKDYNAHTERAINRIAAALSVR